MTDFYVSQGCASRPKFETSAWKDKHVLRHLLVIFSRPRRVALQGVKITTSWSFQHVFLNLIRIDLRFEAIVWRQFCLDLSHLVVTRPLKLGCRSCVGDQIFNTKICLTCCCAPVTSRWYIVFDEVFNLIWFSSELASGLSIKSGMWFVIVGFCFEQSVAIRTRCRWRLRLEDSSWRCLCNHYLLRPGQVRNINIIVSDGNSKSDHHWSVWKNCNDASIVHNFYST